MSWTPTTFTELPVTSSDVHFRNMATGSDGALYVTTPSKVFRSLDGFGTLVDVSPKVPTGGEEYFGVSVAPSGAVFVTLLSGGVYKSINSGVSWTLVCGATHVWRSIHTVSDSVWLVGTLDAGVVRTLDGGSSFETVLAGIKSTQSFTVEPDGTVSMSVLGTIDDTPALQGRIYTTADQGSTWGVKYTAPYDTNIMGAVCDVYSGAYYLGLYDGTTKATLDFVSFTTIPADPIHGGAVLADRAYICSYAGQSISRSAPLIGPAPNAPRIYPSTGILQGIQLVVIQGTGVIRYTLDGSEPSASSPIYTAPFRLSAPTTVKARAYATPLESATATAILDIQGASLQRIPNYRDHVLPYLLDQYKGDNA